MAKHKLEGIVHDAAFWPVMQRRGATSSDLINLPYRTGRATHRAPAHRTISMHLLTHEPSLIGQARRRIGDSGSWDDHFARTYGRTTS